MTPNALERDLGSLYVKHGPLVRRLLARRGIRNEDVEDALQEVFVTVHRLLPSFEGRSSVETWLHSITWRVAANFRRGEERRSVVTAPRPERWIADAPVKAGPDRSLHAVLGRMDEEHRDVIALHDLAEFSISEVSALTGRARATIRERLERGRTALGLRVRSALAKSGDDDWLDELAPPLAARLADPDRPIVHEMVLDELVISTLDNIVIGLWRGDASDAAMEALIEVMFNALEIHPEGIRHLCIVPQSKPPSRASRKLTSWTAGKMGQRLLAAAWAADGTMMSLVAPIMNACFMIGGAPLNARFFGSVGPAATWLAQYGALEAARIEEHVERLRRR